MYKKITLILWLLATVIPFVTLAQKTCEETFQVTECSVCQKTIHDDSALSFFTGVAPSTQCPTNIHFGNVIFEEYSKAGYEVFTFNISTYDLKPFKSAVDKYCALEYTCDPSEVEQTLEKLKTDCATELLAPLDLSADPKTLDVNSLLAYGTFLAYYGGIPAHEAACLKNNKGESCLIEIFTNVIEFAKKETNGDLNASISLDGKTLYLPDGSTKEIPKDLNCGECWTKIANIYLTYIEAHPMDEQLETNIFGGSGQMKEELSAACEDSTEDEGVDVVEMKIEKRGSGDSTSKNGRMLQRSLLSAIW
ncbi:7222_t:CDS:2 [Funneliformis caledonium]|uniref:7222_t:CDS:1 n=1 Tax=Funneliformis caledonium TaxID=1117310 RepID=A0A9N9N6Z7_9GLOM|nr:7222_t:CDS:2 [Funneliformis caledonium]